MYVRTSKKSGTYHYIPIRINILSKSLHIFQPRKAFATTEIDLLYHHQQIVESGIIPSKSEILLFLKLIV